MNQRTFHFKYLFFIVCIHSMKLSHRLAKFCIIILLISKLPRNSKRSVVGTGGKCEPFSCQCAADTLIFLSKPCSYPDSGTNLFLPFLTKAMGVQGSLVIHKKQTKGEVSVWHFCSICCDWGSFVAS